MGQAKRRGTFEQRRAMALEKKMTVELTNGQSLTVNRPMAATPSRWHASRMSIMAAACLAAGALPTTTTNKDVK